MASSMVTSRCLYLSGVRACWNNPVPPSGFVLLALILAQVRDHKISHNVDNVGLFSMSLNRLEMAFIQCW